MSLHNYFTWHRQDAVRLHETLTEIAVCPQAIDILYRRSGADLPAWTLSAQMNDPTSRLAGIPQAPRRLLKNLIAHPLVQCYNADAVPASTAPHPAADASNGETLTLF